MIIYRRVVIFIEETIPAFLLMALVFFIAYGVVMRYIFDYPVLWMNQIATFLFVWQLFLGVAAASRRHRHIGIDILISALAERVKAAQQLLAGVLIIGVLVGFIFLGWQLSLETTKMLQTLNIHYFYVYSAVPIGFSLVALHACEDVFRAARGVWLGSYVTPSAVGDPLMEASTQRVSP